MKSRYIILTLIVCCCLVASFDNPIVHADDKLRPEDVIAKHLEAIGSQEDRASVKTRVIVGVSKYVRHGTGGGTTEGRAVLASENEKYLLGMKFGVPGYDVESVGFDGKELTVGYVSPGVRSPLENLFRNYESTFKHGLLAGTLSSSWSLAINDEKAKIKYAGLKKVEGASLHQLKYQPRKGSDLEVSLFFDSVTFHHVRTEYSRVVSAQIGTGGADSSAGQSEMRFKLVETFSDFKKEGNLTLPHEYRIELQIRGRNAEVHDEWTVTLKDFVFNQPIEPKDFVVDVQIKKSE